MDAERVAKVAHRGKANRARNQTQKGQVPRGLTERSREISSSGLFLRGYACSSGVVDSV
jgi:hypothetical protein